MIKSYTISRLTNKGQSNVNVSYSPPSPQTFTSYFSFYLIKELENFHNHKIKEHGIRLTRSHKYGYNCSIDWPRCVGLSPTKNMLTKL
jgi:hypothetical protein